MWNMLAGKIGGALTSQAGKGLLGIFGGGSQIHKGINQTKNIMGGLGDEESIRNPFSKSQGLLDNLSDITQYAGRGLDAATQQGNTAVRTAAMMGGSGGSMANALRARMKTNATGDIYNAYNENMKNTVLPGQMKIDESVFGEVNNQNALKTDLGLNLAQGNMNMGNKLMPNLSKTLYGKEGILGSIGEKLKGWGG
jgi:hypothetical protein